MMKILYASALGVCSSLFLITIIRTLIFKRVSYTGLGKSLVFKILNLGIVKKRRFFGR